MPDPISFGIGLAIGAIAKAGAGKAAVAGATKLAVGGSAKSVAAASSHVAHAAHAAAHASFSSAALATYGTVLGGVVLGFAGMEIRERLLKNRDVGPTGEKIAHKLAWCAEKGVKTEAYAHGFMDQVEGLSEYEKQGLNKQLDDILQPYVR
jgi:hypothetical protein